MSATVHAGMTAGAQQTARDEVRAEIQTTIRNAIREATSDVRMSREEQAEAARGAAEAARGAAQAARDAARVAVEQATAPGAGMRAPREVIDVLNGQIAAEKQTIESLTNQLTNQTSPAREEVITDQISAAQERLTALQGQLDRALGVSETSSMRPPLPPRFNDNAIPPDVMGIINTFFVVVVVIAIGLPLVRALARRLDRKGQIAIAAAAAGNQNVDPRLERIEQAVEAIAIEVERVSEGQRFTNKLMHELRALPAPNPLEQWPKQGERQGDKEAVRRGE